MTSQPRQPFFSISTLSPNQQAECLNMKSIKARPLLDWLWEFHTNLYRTNIKYTTCSLFDCLSIFCCLFTCCFLSCHYCQVSIFILLPCFIYFGWDRGSEYSQTSRVSGYEIVLIKHLYIHTWLEWYIKPKSCDLAILRNCWRSRFFVLFLGILNFDWKFETLFWNKTL